MKNFESFVILTINLFAATAFSQEQIPYSVFSNMGGIYSNADNKILSTLGESVIGNATNSSNQVLSGFWNVYKQNVITSIEDEETVPIQFKLEQNFPNPFNPTTKISWQSPVGSLPDGKAGWQTLKVYDVLGNEVAMLVNEERAAGRYEITFDAVHLSSGIYFYTLRAGNFVEMKKMVLIK
ncbi:MAG: hypothetical protein A2315_01750 [Ignavibacteria bacterium RIFOXYB2_FULL_35_12]|nr:MAG: hypothetical protein A2058_00200 [Ignavibacteria bacterium GWA2_36_19]OGU51881.1 MAG: hypothetical protein A2006_01775 [Ignavibacteria bacterium GWC2_35_8]OGU57563.1 MAG: hypothetical protein A2X60_00495 [Ignavibacteria bacterium GWF2_35_20]OGU82164.1 MAG: hypothetical protein A2254_08195 [Ignavibacteria bacterium RIFOXYA2_FULL_35_9]OGU87665.1 MAG: hypothetical protein A2492_07750 [Ignavibacteria bacterium RIFOXYC12_FULL_35_11]OGU90951.1 MAG: hypothetical protein A3K31_08435 [Ignavibac